MKVSTKGRYGLRLLLDVALHQDQGPVALREISRRQGISHKYLWQVINPLRAAGFLNVTRGANGGYVLARPLASISMLDVVNVLEGPISFAGSPGTREQGVSRTAREAWVGIEGKLAAAMGSVTLQDLADSHKEQERHRNPTYDI